MSEHGPQAQLALLAGEGEHEGIVCTLDASADVAQERVDQWRDVVTAATGREPADGGITLIYDHDQARTVELARLAAAEFACCSFFTFTLTVGPSGVRFTATAPLEARGVLVAIFGAPPTGAVA